MMARLGDFTRDTVMNLADRAGHHCAYPGCLRPTSVRSRDGAGAVNIGIASHLIAASLNGPRPLEDYPGVTWEQVRCAENGIWLCPGHAVLIDRDIRWHSRERLQGWQREAEERRAEAMDYGDRQRVYASPAEVAARARLFWAAVRDVLPTIPFMMGGTARADQVRRIRDLVRSLYHFPPDHPWNGQAPELVLLQRKIIEDLHGFACLLEDPTRFWRDDDAVFRPVDTEANQEAALRLDVLWADIGRVSEWAQGIVYYGPQRRGGL